jgi:hypothetical protein
MSKKDVINTFGDPTSQYDSGKMADLRHAMPSLP